MYDEQREAGLQAISRNKANCKNRVGPVVEEAVVQMATDYPAYGQLQALSELKKRGIFVSPGGVRSHTGKYCFGRTPLQTFRETKHLAFAKQLDTLFECQNLKSDIPDNNITSVG